MEQAKDITNKRFKVMLEAIIITAFISYIIGIYVGKNFDKFTTE